MRRETVRVAMAVAAAAGVMSVEAAGSAAEFQADCQKPSICGEACVCSASVCSVFEAAPGTIDSEKETQLDATLTDGGNSLVGTMLIRQQRVAVRFTRQ